jgi:ABC-type multidrug transport system fused ATPase/permease subunit
LGLSFFSGIGVFLLAFLTNLGLGILYEKQQKKVMKSKDNRMNHTNEALQNIKTLKFYSWTGIFEEEIQKRREDEVSKLLRISMINSFIIVSLYFFPNILSSVVFSTYIGLGHKIDLATSFSVLVFFDIIKEPLRQLPLFLSFYLQMIVSMKRIQKFIDTKEIDLTRMIKSNNSRNTAISIKNKCFSWG